MHGLEQDVHSLEPGTSCQNFEFNLILWRLLVRCFAWLWCSAFAVLQTFVSRSAPLVEWLCFHFNGPICWVTHSVSPHKQLRFIAHTHRTHCFDFSRCTLHTNHSKIRLLHSIEDTLFYYYFFEHVSCNMLLLKALDFNTHIHALYVFESQSNQPQHKK